MPDPRLAGPDSYRIWSAEQINDVRDNGFKYPLSSLSAALLR